MTQFARHPSYLLIEDQLDALGQRYRVQRIVRGFIIWVSAVIIASFLAAVASHVVGLLLPGGSFWNMIVLALWGVVLVGGAGLWLIKPMIMRPKYLEVARLVESKIDGLHNGLTNGVLLARSSDLGQSPWLPAIFQEIVSGTRNKPLNDAVRFSDLRPLIIRLMCVVLPIIGMAMTPMFQRMLDHGMHQMWNPHAFVPLKGGKIDSVKVEPGDTMCFIGQSLDISILAHSSDASYQPDARLIFDGKLKDAQLVPSLAGDDPTTAAPGAGAHPASGQNLRYGYRVEHVDATMRYRVDVGGTQSNWFTVSVVPQVKLQEVTMEIAPPPYTVLPGQPPRIVESRKPEDIDVKPISVPQGSLVEFSPLIDVPVGSAMLQVDEQSPIAMGSSLGGRKFTKDVTVLQDVTLAALLMGGSKQQILTKVPEHGITIHCVKDAPPSLEMKWPTQDLTVPTTTEVKVRALLKDDYGVKSAQVLVSTSPDQPPTPVTTETYPAGATNAELNFTVKLTPDQHKHGSAIRVQVAVTDNRDLMRWFKDPKDGGPQTTASAIYEIKFRDPEQISAEEKELTEKLRIELLKMLKLQQELYSQTVAFKAGAAKDALGRIQAGQTDLRSMMAQTAEGFKFEPDTKIIQKTLLVMASGPAREAIEFAQAIQSEPVEKEQTKICLKLQDRQRSIIATLEQLLGVLNTRPEATTRPTTREGNDMPNRAEKFEKLNEALKEFVKEEQKILNQTAPLAKKPVDNFDDKDRQLMEQLKQAQDKLDAFMQEKIADFSKNAEQDMSNAGLIKDLLAVYSEVTMAKDALKAQSAEIAVAAEDMGLEGAKEISSNIEKWLPDKPDRQKWTQEDPTSKTDTPMPELPKEIEDMVGKLMEQQEDVNDEMEDANANWTDSMDKGVGWDAMDGPIADMSAKGVTGNTLPNNNEMAGRSGEGRSGKSQGEFVGDNAQGKGGRNTPTRVDPTPFAAGQIKDESKDPVGGATGGGKLSGQGAAGLEGPVGPKIKQEMQRLAEKQAQLRNEAERLQLKMQLGRYDNFNLMEAIALMRRNESDLRSNRYQNAMRRRDVIVDELGTSKLLLGGQVHVQQDTTPQGNTKIHQEINDAMKGDLPAAWSDALKEYYKKLSAE